MDELSPDDQSFLDRFRRWKHRPKSYGDQAGGAPTPQDVYADLMKHVFAPALREVGLKGSGGRFELPSETHWAQIGFQKSAYSDGQEVRFTVNLSVIDRDVWTTQAAAKPYLGARPSPGTLYGTFQQRARLGQLVTGGEDLWWRILRGKRTEAVGTEVRDALVTIGVPWLRSAVEDSVLRR